MEETCVLEMNNGVLLEATLKEILHAITPLAQDLQIRQQIINEVRAVVQSIESLRGATVEPYGSFVSDLYTRWGDLDISVELPNGLYISSAGKKHKQSLLGEVRTALRKRGASGRLHLIANARIPILKFETSFDVSCDISINNLSAQMKSKLLYWISGIDKRFRAMVLLVKEWAKAHHINDAKSGSLNSYSLSLLVIFHLQTCVPPILPPLREIYPGNMADNLTGVRVVAEKHIEETCADNINRYKSDRTRRINRSLLSEIFISFIEKFCDISSRASTQGVCPYSGQWEEIYTNMRWLPKTYALFIEDPFEQPANTARTVSERKLQNISEAFQTTFNILTAPRLGPLPLVSALVTPQISQILSERHVGIHSYSNGTRAQHQPPPLLLAPRVQVQQSHNMRHDRRPNRTTGTANDKRPNGTTGAENDRRPNRTTGAEYDRRRTDNDGRSNGTTGTANDRRPNGTTGAENDRRSNRTTGTEIDRRRTDNDGRSNGTTGTANDRQQPNRNTGANRPVQARPNQSQKIWRPRSDA